MTSRSWNADGCFLNYGTQSVYWNECAPALENLVYLSLWCFQTEPLLGPAVSLPVIHQLLKKPRQLEETKAYIRYDFDLDQLVSSPGPNSPEIDISPRG